MSEDYIEKFAEYPVCTVCGVEIDLQEPAICTECLKNAPVRKEDEAPEEN